MLSVYVDDFKLAGPAKNLEKGWGMLRSNLDLDPPTPLGTYLGCGHQDIEIDSQEVLQRTRLSKHILKIEREGGNSGRPEGGNSSTTQCRPQHARSRGVQYEMSGLLVRVSPDI